MGDKFDSLKELQKKIGLFEEKSGLNLYDEIMDDFFKIDLKLQDLYNSRENWRKKYFELKDKQKEKKK